MRPGLNLGGWRARLVWGRAGAAHRSGLGKRPAAAAAAPLWAQLPGARVELRERVQVDLPVEVLRALAARPC